MREWAFWSRMEMGLSNGGALHAIRICKMTPGFVHAIVHALIHIAQNLVAASGTNASSIGSCSSSRASSCRMISIGAGISTSYSSVKHSIRSSSIGGGARECVSLGAEPLFWGMNHCFLALRIEHFFCDCFMAMHAQICFQIVSDKFALLSPW